MNSHLLLLLLPIFVLFLSATAQDSIGLSKNPIPRRILHQPLFPESSTPPPVLQSPPPPPQNGPFFPEVPGESSPDQTQPQLQPPSANVAAVPNPIATQPTKPTKKVAIVVSVGIVTLGMFSALGFYIYKQRLKLSGESHKLVGGDNPRQIRDDSGIPPSSFLYTGTAEQASSRNSLGDSNRTNGSPYRKLRSDRYRPSPELHPLPPLTKPPLPPMDSPPRSSYSDEEGPETAFYTPHGSTVSNDSFRITDAGTATLDRAESAPNPNSYHLSKRTSPKSRISASLPELKATVYPTIKQTPPPPPPPPPSLPRPSQLHPKKTELSASPTPRQKVQKPGIPLPPPPPPPLLSTPRKLGGGSKGVLQQSKPSQDLVKSPPPTSSIPKVNPEIQRTESNESASSAERIDGDEEDGLKPRLKPLHWDKVRATSDRATVWDQLKSSSFQLNEDMMESLFGCNSANSAVASKSETRKSVLPPVEKENRVLDPKKSQNIAILLRALSVTREEVTDALLDGNPEGLGAELLETLVKMAPTKEEEIKLRDYNGDVTKLGTAERFLKSVLEVPFAFKRVEAMLYRANFDTEVQYLRQSFQTLEAASEELKNSRLFLKLLEAVLKSGNRMNVGTNRGAATSFKLDTLLKLVDIKGTDGKTTLLHFVVQEIVRSEGALSDPTRTSTTAKEDDFRKQGLRVVAGLSKELGDVKKAAGMDSVVLSSYLEKLETGLQKVRAAMEMERSSMHGKFVESMEVFVGTAAEEIARVKDEEKKALGLVRDVTQYFHGDAAREEAHPLRIFLIVRDFLSILDHVCKEVGRMDNVVVGSAQSFRMPPAASLPVHDKFNMRRHSSDH